MMQPTAAARQRAIGMRIVQGAGAPGEMKTLELRAQASVHRCKYQRHASARATTSFYSLGRPYRAVNDAFPIELALTMNPASAAVASGGISSFSVLSACTVNT